MPVVSPVHAASYGPSSSRFMHDAYSQAVLNAKEWKPFGSRVQEPHKPQANGSSSHLFMDDARVMLPVDFATTYAEADQLALRGPCARVPQLTKVPLAKQSRIVVHSGFWNILSAANQSQGGAPKRALMKKRISVNMIGPPVDFRHVCHASDAEQAFAILAGLPTGQDQHPSPPSPEDLAPPRAAFATRTTNSECDQAAVGTVRLRAPSPAPRPSPRWSIDDVRIEHEYERPATPKPFVPSLGTIEKAVACRVFFETHYYAILKQPQAREQRRLALERELAQLNISDAERQNVRAAFALSETAHLRDKRQRLDASSFKKLKTIGHGAFGVVSLVRELQTGELFAMKSIRKGDMLKKGQEGHIKAERDLLVRATVNTRRIVPLHASFQDSENLYLILNYMPGGDLLTLLIERDTFSEDFTRFYMAEMILALQETHQTLDAIHRDIKPDNFLFDRHGHIYLSDFGLSTDFHWSHDAQYYDMQRKGLLKKHGLDVEDGSRAPRTRPFDQDMEPQLQEAEPPGSLLTWRDQNRRRLAYSVVGTNNYMAVEVLRGQGYDNSADWWSLGCILFECLFGYPPFLSKNRQQTRQKILNWRQFLRFPSRPRISREAQDLVLQLLREPNERLGSIARGRATAARAGQDFVEAEYDGACAIMSHPWFRGVNFETLHEQTPPFVPQLNDELDTRYFDEDIEDAPLPPAEPRDGNPERPRDPLLRHETQGEHLLEMRKQLAFQGWTFRKPRRAAYDQKLSLADFANGGATTSGSAATWKGPTGSAFARSMSV